MNKAQSDIISAVIIVVLSLGFISTVYIWGIPLIQKRQDTTIVDRVSTRFDQNNENSLPSIIEFVANNQGEQVFNLDVDGLWFLNETEDSIAFVFFSKISKIAVDTGFISITPGSGCPPTTGFVAIDKASVVCASADRFADGYNITYKIYFRQLNETFGQKGYEIDLLRHEASPSKSTGKVIRIFYAGREEIAGQLTLISTKIKILLV